ncbi:hypothetical protein AMTRI_Chr04g188510 [Amborella trichopoda]
MEQNLRLKVDDGVVLDNPGFYRRFVGRLIYLTIICPDITYSVHVLSQFMQTPCKSHLDAAQRVLQYLKAALGHGILLPSTSDLTITAYSNLDWASCPMTRPSTTRYITLLGAISAQETSSCESTWLKFLFIDLAVSHSQPMHPHCDNQAALYIVANSVFHERTKYIELDYHLIREKIQSGLISTSYVPSRFQLVDIFTKPFGYAQFHWLKISSILSKLGVRYVHAPA